MDSSQFEKISAKLDRIINLVALDAVKTLESDEQIRRLSGMGFQPSEIAVIVGRTPNAVRIALHYLRKKKSPEPEESVAEIHESKGEEEKP